MFSTNSNILIVDDMTMIRKLAKKILQQNNFKQIIEAVDGQQAWEKLTQEGNIDLIISDWNMPNLTGIELLTNVRKNDLFKNIPFILLTAEADAAQVKQALEAGVDNYIIKPFSADSLISKLEITYKKTLSRLTAA